MIPANEQIIVKNFRTKKYGYLLCEGEHCIVVENYEHTEAQVWPRKYCIMEINQGSGKGHGK